jgi:DNA-binding winged helix-turn-helix (wHTH) protein
MSNVAYEPSDEIKRARHWVVAQGVAVVPWPLREPERSSSTHLRPAVFLVEPGAEPPTLTDDLSDWLQLPGDPEELHARARTLLARARAHGRVLTYVDDDDVLRVGDRLAVLSPIEARIVRILLDHVGTVVPRERLNREIWPDRPVDDLSVLNNRVKLLRQHISGLPLRIHTVRGRGLLLEVASLTRRSASDVYRPQVRGRDGDV